MTIRSDILLDIHHMMDEGEIERKRVQSLLPQVQEVFHGLTDLRRLGQLPFRDLPYQNVQRILEKAEGLRQEFETILLIGIGGSSLGPQLLSQGLALPDRGGPEIVICDTLDPAAWKGIADRLDFKKTLVLVVSKSGKTIETLAALLYFRQCLEERGKKDCKKQIFVITDPHEGPLRKLVSENGFDHLEIPPGVGGRYSVLTPVGLFPAACQGIDVRELLAGAQRMDERCQHKDPWFNPALMSAVLHYLADTEKGKKIRVTFTYGERLKAYGPWFSQLWAESLGKRFSLSGKEIFAGMTPISALGPQDQHSQLQLYLEGPNDKVVTFVAAETERQDLKIPTDPLHISEAAELQGKTVHELLQLECRATALALREAGRLNQTISLREIHPYNLGQLIYFAEVETVFAGELYDVNPFDQPGVEIIKKNIRRLLRGQLEIKKNRSWLI